MATADSSKCRGRRRKCFGSIESSRRIARGLLARPHYTKSALRRFLFLFLFLLHFLLLLLLPFFPWSQLFVTACWRAGKQLWRFCAGHPIIMIRSGIAGKTLIPRRYCFNLMLRHAADMWMLRFRPERRFLHLQTTTTTTTTSPSPRLCRSRTACGSTRILIRLRSKISDSWLRERPCYA